MKLRLKCSVCFGSSDQLCSHFPSEYLKPIAEEERRVEEAEKKTREEQERIYKQLSEGSTEVWTHGVC